MQGILRKLRFGAVLVLLCGLAVPPLVAVAAGSCFGIKGVSLASFGWDGYASPTSDEAQRYIKSLGANTIVFLRTYDVDVDSDHIDPNSRALPSKEHIEHAVKLAQSLGLNTVLKLHFVDQKDRGDVLANSLYVPHNPDTFFASYKSIVLDNAALAQQLNVGTLVIGTELGGLVTGNPQFRSYFSDIIDQARKAYSGKLTLATQVSTHVDAFRNGPGCTDRKSGRNWCMASDEASFVTFWDKLDYIGIDAYPNLSANPKPEIDELRAAFHRDKEGRDFLGKVAAIVHRNGDKPLLLTEVGASSVANAHGCTGCWGIGKQVDNDIQSRIYQASLDTLCKEAPQMHLAGVLLWAIDAFPNSRAKQDPTGIDPVGFTFQHKPAEAVVRSVFGGSSSAGGP